MTNAMRQLLAKAKRAGLTPTERACLGLHEFALTRKIEPLERELKAVRKALAAPSPRGGGTEESDGR